MAYDPWGGLARGIEAGFGLYDLFQRRGLRERTLGLEEHREKRLQQLFDLQMEQKLREEEERKAVPGAMGALLTAARPPVSELDLQSGMAEGVGIADIATATRPARTVPELMGRGLTPEHLELLARRTPAIFGLAGIQAPEVVAKEERAETEKQRANALSMDALADLRAGRRGEAALKLYQAGTLSGRNVPIKDVLDLIEDEGGSEEVKTLADLTAEAMGGNEEAAKQLVSRALGARSKGGRALAGPVLTLGSNLLGAKISPKVKEGMEEYHRLHQIHKDPLKAWSELERTRPDLSVAMDQAKVTPRGVEIATKAATQRAGGESVKTIEGEALEISRMISAREFPNDPEKRAALTGRIESLMSAGRTGGIRSAADLHAKIQEAIGELKGIGAPPPPAVKDQQAIQSWWQRIFGGGQPEAAAAPAPGAGAPAERPAPGRPGPASVRANPPPASPTRRDALAEAERLMGLGYSEEETVAAMRRAGWSGAGGGEAFLTP